MLRTLPALAQPAPAPRPEADRAAPMTEAARPRAAIAAVAGELAKALPQLEGRVLVGVTTLETDAKATRPDPLVLAVGALVAGQRKFEAPAKPEVLRSLIARARGASAVVLVSVRIDKGRLLATADVHPVPATVWARIKNPVPGPIAHVFAEAPIDAEVRSHLDPVPLTAALELVRGRNFESGVLALACGDLDRDGAPEIVAVSESQVTLLRLRGGKVHPEVSRPWSDLSPVDPSPWREPIAQAIVVRARGTDPPGERDVVVSSTARALAARLDARLQARTSFPAYAIPDAGSFSCARMDGLTVTGPLAPCEQEGIAPVRASVGGRYDGLAGARLFDAAGKFYDVWAGREDGIVEVVDGRGRRARIPGAGGQIAIGDLDQDGVPEILVGLDVELRSGADALVIYSWPRDDKPPTERVRMPVAAGVRALSVCTPDGPGRTAFVMATSDEIVVLR